MKRICVLGDGAWGTAIAHLLASNGHQVNWWCFNKDVADDVIKNRINSRFLPGTVLPQLIVPITDINQAITDVDVICEAIPVKYLRSSLNLIDKNQLSPYIPWIILSKGFEDNYFLLPADIVCGIIRDWYKYDIDYAVISGPSFAQEIVKKILTAVTITGSPYCIDITGPLFCNDYFKLVRSFDDIGVQWCGALKNVIALACGIVDGAGYGHNTKSLVITRGLQEIEWFITFEVGPREAREAILSLAGIGDLVLTTTSPFSKNVTFGQKLGTGKPPSQLIDKKETEPEGVNTLKALYHYLHKKGQSRPFWDELYKIVHYKAPIQGFLQTLA